MSNSTKFMTDGDGNPSSMRLMSMLALIVAAVLACVEVFWLGFGRQQDRAGPLLPGRCIRPEGGAEIRRIRPADESEGQRQTADSEPLPCTTLEIAIGHTFLEII